MPVAQPGNRPRIVDNDWGFGPAAGAEASWPGLRPGSQRDQQAAHQGHHDAEAQRAQHGRSIGAPGREGCQARWICATNTVATTTTVHPATRRIRAMDGRGDQGHDRGRDQDHRDGDRADDPVRSPTRAAPGSPGCRSREVRAPAARAGGPRRRPRWPRRASPPAAGPRRRHASSRATPHPRGCGRAGGQRGMPAAYDPTGPTAVAGCACAAIGTRGRHPPSSSSRWSTNLRPPAPGAHELHLQLRVQPGDRGHGRVWPRPGL